jgi:preprotein translocase subunit SecY
MGLVIFDDDVPEKVVRSGFKTEKYLLELTNRLAILGGIFLAFIATLPIMVSYLNSEIGVFKNIGATSLVIFVSVAFDLARQIRSELLTEYYKRIS